MGEVEAASVCRLSLWEGCLEGGPGGDSCCVASLCFKEDGLLRLAVWLLRLLGVVAGDSVLCC